MPPPERAEQAAEPQIPTPPDPAGSGINQLEGSNAEVMPRANGLAFPADQRAENITAAVPQELAEILDVGERPSPIIEPSKEFIAVSCFFQLMKYHRRNAMRHR